MSSLSLPPALPLFASAVALDLVTGVLEPLTRLGVTVVCVLQQPRPEIFSRLQHVIMMQEGGCAFEGPPSAVAPYLQSLGYAQPEEASDADFAVDVLNGLVTRQALRPQRTGVSSASNSVLSDSQGKGSSTENDCDLVSAWHATSDRELDRRTRSEFGSTAKAAAASASAIPAPVLSSSSDGSGSDVDPATSGGSTVGIGFWRLVWLQAVRAMAVRLRQRGSLAIYAVLHAVMAAALSAGFSILIHSSYQGVLGPPVRGALLGYCPSVLGSFCNERNAEDLGFAQLLFFASSAIGIASALATVPIFGGQVPIMQREALAGLHPLAYVCGRLLADAVFTTWFACLFTGAWMLFGHAGHWYGWLGVVLPTAFAGAGIGAAMVAFARGQSLSAAVGSVV